MSGDEVLVLVASVIVAMVVWLSWYRPILLIERLRASEQGHGVLLVTPAVCAAILFLVLRTVASFDVVADFRYIVMYLTLGAAWIGTVAAAFPLLGLSARDDVVERANGAAAAAVAGALVATTLCFAGGNVGDGPGWWVVVFSAALATGGLFAAWGLLETLTRVADTVTIERDLAAGCRLGAFLIATGLILGRAVAGDWVTAGATVGDFLRIGWPIVILVAAAVVLERLYRPTPERPAPRLLGGGVLPALIYLTSSAAYVTSLGRPA